MQLGDASEWMTSRPSTAAPILAVLAVVLGMPVLYMLSTGPAFWLWWNGWLTREYYDAYARPAFAVVERSGGIQGRLAYNKYVSWWSFDERAMPN
jgi:hypothetical protein